MRKIVLLLFAILMLGAGAFAQKMQISGTVTSEDGQPIIGASVIIQGTNSGTTTSATGKFSLPVAKGSKLQISFIGYETKVFDAVSNVLNVTLKVAATQLDDIVVTAMGISRSEKTLGYAATTVAGETLSQARNADVISSLSGKIAGVQISAAGSDPGSANSVIIRGISSLGGNNQPLYIVDGVPIINNITENSATSRQYYSMGNGANMVNPDDVENVTVLKGAAATALYGSRAAAGVILINTKSGKKGQSLNVEINSGVQISTINKLPEFQNKFGMGWYGEVTLDENGSWGPIMDGKDRVYGPVYNNSQLIKPFRAEKNNYRDFFESGVMYSNSATISGGNDQTTFHAGLSQVRDDGIMPTAKDSYKNTTMSFRGTHSYNKWLDVSSSLNFSDQDVSSVFTGQGATVIDGVLEMPRNISIVDLQDLTNPFNQPGYYFTPYGITNPYYPLKYNNSNLLQKKLFGKFQLDMKPLDGLKVTYRFGFDYSDSERKLSMPKIDATGTPNSGSVDQTGSVENVFTRRYEINHDFFGVYTSKFEKIDLSATLGVNINERSASGLNASVTDLTLPTYYDLSNSSGTPVVGEPKSLRRLIGLFGDVQVGYDNMVFLGLTARNDWSSTLPLDHNSFFYPGITGSFVFTELFENKDVLSFGKVRLAWGKTGNDAAPYLVYSSYVQGYANNSYSAATSFPIGGVNAYKLANTIGNSSLEPEMTTEFEIGANLQFFKGRVGFDASVYNRVSDNQIFTLPIDPATGYRSMVTNLGEVSNKGIELLITTVPVKTKDLTWTVDFNFSKNKSRVESLPEELGGEILLNSFTTSNDAVYMKAEVGKPVGTFWTLNTVKDPNGNVVCSSETGLPVKTSEAVYSGLNMNFDWEGGVVSSIKYKDFTISTAIDIRQGGYMFSRTKSLMAFSGNGLQTLYNDRNTYIVPNSVNAIYTNNVITGYQENVTPISAKTVSNGQDNFANGFNFNADDLLERSYVKMRNLTISYDIPSALVKKVNLKGVKVSFVGNNLFIWTPKNNIYIDPESTTEGADLSGKFGELYVNPSTRRLGFNVQVKF